MLRPILLALALVFAAALSAADAPAPTPAEAILAKQQADAMAAPGWRLTGPAPVIRDIVFRRSDEKLAALRRLDAYAAAMITVGGVLGGGADVETARGRKIQRVTEYLRTVDGPLSVAMQDEAIGVLRETAAWYTANPVKAQADVLRHLAIIGHLIGDTDATVRLALIARDEGDAAWFNVLLMADGHAGAFAEVATTLYALPALRASGQAPAGLLADVPDDRARPVAAYLADLAAANPALDPAIAAQMRPIAATATAEVKADAGRWLATLGK